MLGDRNLFSDDETRRTGRNERYHLILIAGTAVLQPAFLLFAAFMVWVAYIQTNALNFVAVCISVVMPAVMYVGCRGATKRSEPVLRAYSFALAVVVTMQLSTVVVIMLDDGSLADAYVESCAVGFLTMCNNLDDLPVGAGWLDTGEMCACTSSEARASRWGTMYETLGNTTSNGEQHR